MRRAVASATMLALMLVAVALPAKAASAGDRYKFRYYEGSTTEGGRLRIVVLVSDSVVRLGSLLVDPGPYRCEDGTEGEIGTGVAWVGHGGPVLTDQHLELSDNWQVIAFSVSGRLGVHGGSGTVTFLLPGLTADEQAQVCAIGELAWTVERTASDGGFPFGRAALVQRLDKGRTVTTDLGATGPGGTTVVARAEAGPTRHYRGRTSLDLSMAAQTRRVDTGIELLALSFGFKLACDDGSELGGGARPMIESPTVMPPGRLDLERATVGPGDALHLHGELDAHAGAGTVEIIWSVITEDLQAQLCKSGEQTWELWRTDAGY